MKTFAHPLRIEVQNKKQHEEVYKELKNLGYTGNIPGHLDLIYPKWIVTNDTEHNGWLCSYDHSVAFNKTIKRYVISEYNLDLIIALASQTTSKEFEIGEWVVVIDNHGLSASTRAIGKIRKIEHDMLIVDWVAGHNKQDHGGYKTNRFLKATKEEIISHFTQKETIMKEDKNEIVHYEVIKKVPLSGYPVGTKLSTKSSFSEYAQYPEFFQPVTKGDVQFEALCKEATERGFVPGAKYRDEDGKIQIFPSSINWQRNYFDSKQCFLACIGSDILWRENRGWVAEVISSSIKIGNYDVEFLADNEVKIGCQEFDFDELKTVQRLLGDPINAEITIHGTKFTRELIKEIIDNTKD